VFREIDFRIDSCSREKIFSYESGFHVEDHENILKLDREVKYKATDLLDFITRV